jgi:hypothetical protein
MHAAVSRGEPGGLLRVCVHVRQGQCSAPQGRVKNPVGTQHQARSARSAPLPQQQREPPQQQREPQQHAPAPGVPPVLSAIWEQSPSYAGELAALRELDELRRAAQGLALSCSSSQPPAPAHPQQP